MLGCELGSYIRTCGAITGGVNDLLVGDANDFDWTSGADDANGDDTGYETVARHTGATTSTQVGSATINIGGSGYTSAPTVTFTGGGGSGATATATLAGDAVVGVTVTSGGTGYTSAPTIGFTGGAGSGATATAALSSGGAYLFPVTSLINSISVEVTQSSADGSTSAYEYLITANLAQMSQALTNFSRKLDRAAACCQLVIVWRSNDDKVFVIGEKYVDGVSIPAFRVRQDGTKFVSGKVFADFNGGNLSLKGSYSRGPYEYTGGFGDIEALNP